MIRKIKVNGDIATPLPDRLEGTHQLDLTEDQYNRFTGSRFFVVENGEPRAITAQEEADMHAAEQLNASKSALKADRDAAMDAVTVTHNSKNWTFKAIDMQRFMGKINLDRDFGWKADDDSIVVLTPTVAYNIALKVDDVMTQAFMDAETAIGLL